MTQMLTHSLKKHVGAVHVSGKLSLLKRKIANVLLLNAYDNLPYAEEHSISIQDLADIAGFNSKDFELLKEAFRDLAKTTVEWNILTNDGNEDWTVSTLLSRATIRKGRAVCLYAYDRELSKKLYHPDMYARINLTIQRKFKSGYALVLYENCARFRKVKTTGWITVEDWRKLFGVEPDEYREFKDFSKRVLKPAIAEVNRESDLEVEADYRRQKRKISQIRFTIGEQTKVDQLALDKLKGKDVSTILERLSFAGISKPISSKLILEHDEKRILRNLDYVEKELRSGKRITNIGGYTTKAIQSDYGIAETERQQKIKHKKNEAARQLNAQTKIKENKPIAHKAAALKLEADFEALCETAKQTLIEQTLASFSEGDYMIKEYKQRGLKSVLFYRTVLGLLKQQQNA